MEIGVRHDEHSAAHWRAQDRRRPRGAMSHSSEMSANLRGNNDRLAQQSSVKHTCSRDRAASVPAAANRGVHARRTTRAHVLQKIKLFDAAAGRDSSGSSYKSTAEKPDGAHRRRTHFRSHQRRQKGVRASFCLDNLPRRENGPFIANCGTPPLCKYVYAARAQRAHTH